MRALALVVLILVPLAAAQNDSVDPPDVYPTDEAPGPQQSLEGGPGIVYGVFVVALVVGLAVVLGYVSWKQRRNPPSGPR